MKKGLICLSIVAILTLCVLNIAAASTSKQTDEVHSGYTLDVPVKEQPFLVPLPNHNVTAVNTSVDLFAGLATVTSSEIIEKEKEHAYTMSNGSTPLKVRIAFSTSVKYAASSGQVISGDYFTDMSWFAHLGVSEIHLMGESDANPHPEVTQLAKAYGITPIYDIENSQATAPFTNPMSTYTESELALFRSQLQGIKDAGWSGISCEGLSVSTVSIIRSYLPFYFYVSAGDPNGVRYNGHVPGTAIAQYQECYWKDVVYGSGKDDLTAIYLSTFEGDNQYTPHNNGMVLGCFGEYSMYSNKPDARPCDFSEDPGAVLTLLQNMYNAGIDINGFTFYFFNGYHSVIDDGVGGGIHAGMSNTWNFVQSLNGLPYYPPGTGHSFPTVSAWRK